MSTIICTHVEQHLPAACAFVGRDLHAAGWTLAAPLPKPGRGAPIRCIAGLPRGRGRYWLLLGAAALGLGDGIAVPPAVKRCPERLTVDMPIGAPTNTKMRRLVRVACACGLHGTPAAVPGPFPLRRCVSFSAPVRAALEAAQARYGGSIAEWVRWLVLPPPAPPPVPLPVPLPVPPPISCGD